MLTKVDVTDGEMLAAIVYAAGGEIRFAHSSLMAAQCYMENWEPELIFCEPYDAFVLRLREKATKEIVRPPAASLATARDITAERDR